MGHRANYAICENGAVSLHYSHWGARTVAEDIFWGPARTEEFIRKNSVTTEWLDSVWAEGGIALNKDTRTLTYCYREWPDEDDIREAFETLLAQTWAADGWAVCHAAQWREIPEAVGVDGSMLTAEASAPDMVPLDDLGKNIEQGAYFVQLSVRTDKDWTDYAIDVDLAGLLMNGPSLLEGLSAVATLDKLRTVFAHRADKAEAKTLGDWLWWFCAIDVAARTIRVSPPWFDRDAFLFVIKAWPEWDVANGSGSVRAHWWRTGRKTPGDLQPSFGAYDQEPNRSFAECVQLIREHLAQSDQRKAETLATSVRIAEKLSSDSPITIAPGFLEQVPSSRPLLLDRALLAIRLFTKRFRS